MKIPRFVKYIITPAVIGGIAGFVAEKSGYDMQMVEGMKQSLIAGLPTAALIRSEKHDYGYVLEFSGEHPYIYPLISAGILAGFYYLGGLGMELLTEKEINQGFTSIVGGIEGIINGMILSSIERKKKDFIG